MKIKVSLKDPDGFFESVTEAVEKEVNAMLLSEDEKDSIIEDRRETVFETLSKWVEYQECIEIEFDTEAKTATVIEQ